MSKLSFDIDAILQGKSRLTEAQALELHQTASLHDLGNWANAVTQRMHSQETRTYVIDRNINYTNICTAHCTFCAFRRDHEDADSYTLTHEKIGEKIRELLAIGGTQILMQGGMNDRLPIEWYEELLRYIRTNFPTIHIHAFSPPEFIEFERFFGMDVREIIRRFKAAGLATIPGGGGEIFSPRVRKRIGLGKCTGDDWLRVMRVAHEEGMNTSCTMLIGHIEFARERIEHMAALRDMQDYSLALRGGSGVGGGESEENLIHRAQSRWPGVFEKSIYNLQPTTHDPRPTGSYTAFIHWPFQRENTPLGHATEWNPEVHGPFDDSTNEDILRGRVVRMAGADEYLRTLAVARLFLDNIASLQSSWVTMGPKIGQLAMFFGANDMGSVMMEENVVSAAGTTYRLNEREICRLIRDAGWIPAQRDQYYNILKRHDGADSPDLLPDPAARVRNVRQIDKQFIGAAPGLDDSADRNVTVQLPILGSAEELMSDLWHQLAAQAEITLAAEQVDRLSRFIDLLLEANQRMNLTRIDTREAAEIGHVGDALTLLPFLPKTSFRLADVGSGGGVPGIPLAIARPDARVVLIESTLKKARFLEETVQQLDLKNVRVAAIRAEDEARGDNRASYDIVTARAVGAMGSLVQWCLPLVKPGGKLLAMKGAKITEELPLALPVIRRLGGANPIVHPVALPGAEHHVVVEVSVARSGKASKKRRP